MFGIWMLTKFVKRFSSSCKVMDRIQAAEAERQMMIRKVYQPELVGKGHAERLKLMYSGRIWLKYAELAIRPKSISRQVVQELEDLDKFILERKIDKWNLLKDEALWSLFKTILTHESTAIEGNRLTLEQTQEVLIGNNISDEEISHHDVNEVINNGEVMEYIKTNILAKSKSIDEEGVVLINKLVFPEASEIRISAKDVPNDAKYRKLSIYVKGSSSVRPFPHELPSLMKELFTLHAEKSKSLHPVILACQFHMNFLWIHPFLDGNGRTARLLTNILLFNSGYLGIIIPVSERSQYMSFFDLEKKHDTTAYFLYMISKIKETIKFLGL